MTRDLLGPSLSGAVGLCVTMLALAGPVTATVHLQPFLSGLSSPLYLTHARDGSGRVFVVEQEGRIKVVAAASTTPSVFLDISDRVLSGGEQGLLGLAFHPRYAANGRFFVNYTRKPDGATVIAEYHVSADPIVASSTETVLLTIPQPFANHNGGMIEFGLDGLLYIGTGDGGAGNDPGNRAQNLNDLLGKILRIDIERATPGLPYGIPSDNPFVGSGGREEIYALGLRNPFRFSFDRVTGQLLVGDVGQGALEEVDIVTRGVNLGWRVFEGTQCTGLDPGLCARAGFTPPIGQYGHTAGRCAITGGYTYRGSLGTLSTGTYVFGDFCSGEIFTLVGSVPTVLLDSALNISSFGEDETGELYVVDLGGTVHRLVADSNTAALINLSARAMAQTGSAVMIGGFIIGGTTAQTVLIRARGPSMAGAPFDVPGTLTNPFLRLFSGPTLIAQNDDWQDAPVCAPLSVCGGPAQIAGTGLDPCQPNLGQPSAPPGCTQEAAILITLPPGTYTAIVSGVGDTSGVGLVEVFAVDESPSRLINISARATVQTGSAVMIGGFIIGGTTARTVLIRARGPSMAGPPFDVPGALTDPFLQLFSGSTLIAQNDDWEEAPACDPGFGCGGPAQITATGLDPCQPNPGQPSAPSGCAQEAAILITVDPGAYTVHASGVGGAVGIGLIEIFDIGPSTLGQQDRGAGITGGAGDRTRNTVARLGQDRKARTDPPYPSASVNRR